MPGNSPKFESFEAFLDFLEHGRFTLLQDITPTEVVIHSLSTRKEYRAEIFEGLFVVTWKVSPVRYQEQQFKVTNWKVFCDFCTAHAE